ncbi:MAG: helix-turn-helix transcriptional regulator [Vicinamibacteraceae bacterium]
MAIAQLDAPRIIAIGPVHLIHVCPPAGAVVDPAAPEVAINLMLQPPPLLQVGFNRQPRWLAMSPGVMLAAPPDTAAEFIADGPARVLAMTIPTARVDEFTEAGGGRVCIRHEETFRDPRLMARLVGLWRAAVSDAPGGRLLADQVMREALQALARRSDGRADARPGRERLAAHVVRRLRDYVESRLDDDLDVTALAAVAATSPAHFARAFAATIGTTPFRYVMTRRLARARELLERTDRPTQAIALDVGFKAASHFTARFRREFGVTPGELRDRRGVRRPAPATEPLHDLALAAPGRLE